MNRFLKNVVKSVRDKADKWKKIRYRAASIAQFAGVSELKQKVKTKLGINFIQRWTNPSRVKQRVFAKLKIYNNPVMTKIREISKGKIIRTLNNMRPTEGRSLRFNKLKTYEPKARPSRQIPKSKYAYKPLKQAKDVTKVK